MNASWVLRTAQQRRVCSNCDDWIYEGSRYWFTMLGESLCCECPPDGEESVCE